MDPSGFEIENFALDQFPPERRQLKLCTPMEENAMRLPLQITFRHVDPSPSVEDRIREYAGELDRFFDQIIAELRILDT